MPVKEPVSADSSPGRADVRAEIVSLEGADFTYAEAAAPALRDVTLAVHEGERIAIVGPGGSGKSTLCRLLSGTLRSSPEFGSLAGRCRLLGAEREDGFTALEAAGIIGSVSQDPETGLVMDEVEDELAFGPENLGRAPERIEALVREALDAVGLPQPLRSERTLALSGGQQQRVAIAAALAMEPRLLVLDDAAANLDADGAAQLEETLRRLQRSGTALVTASPRWDGAAAADRVVLLDGGRIAASGAPRDVLVRHRDTLLQLGCLPSADEQESGETREQPQVRNSDAQEQPHARGSVAHVQLQAQGVEMQLHLQGGNKQAQPRLRSAGRSPVLEARGLRYAYPGSGREALRGVNAVVREGDVVAVCGPNGSGKTTLGKLAAGLLPAPPETLLLAGKPVAAYAVQELAGLVGYVFQRPERQFVADTVLEECAFGLRARRGGEVQEADTAHAVRLLSECGLGHALDAHPRSLPVAEQRLLNLAAALVLGPALLILDEPTAGLDYGAADRFMRLVAGFAAEGGAALVMTHDEYVIRRWTTSRLTLGA